MKTLREWRTEKMLTILDLAEQAKVSNKTISDIENGKVIPKFRTIKQISEALGISNTEIAEFMQPRS